MGRAAPARLLQLRDPAPGNDRAEQPRSGDYLHRHANRDDPVLDAGDQAVIKLKWRFLMNVPIQRKINMIRNET